MLADFLDTLLLCIHSYIHIYTYNNYIGLLFLCASVYIARAVTIFAPHVHMYTHVYICQVLDQWELQREDIELMKDKPLGQGAFGEVIRGLLKPNAMKRVSRRKNFKNWNHNFSLTCIVAVKMLKGLTILNDILSSLNTLICQKLEMWEKSAYFVVILACSSFRPLHSFGLWGCWVCCMCVL